MLFFLYFSTSTMFKREYEIHYFRERSLKKSVLSVWPCLLLWQAHYLGPCKSQRNTCCFFALLPAVCFSLLWVEGGKKKLQLCGFWVWILYVSALTQRSCLEVWLNFLNDAMLTNCLFFFFFLLTLQNSWMRKKLSITYYWSYTLCAVCV